MVKSYKGLSPAVTAFIITIATLILMVSVFSLYSVYIVNVNSNTVNSSSLVGLSNVINIQLSSISYKGNGPAYKTFNVSYLITVNAPVRQLTLLIFNQTTMPNVEPYYYLPNQATKISNVELAKIGLTQTSSGISDDYVPVTGFIFNHFVYLPQNNQGLGYVIADAYNITSNTTYYLSLNISPTNIIVFWVLYSHLGKWYRLGFTYTVPSSQQLGLKILASGALGGGGNYEASQLPNVQSPNYVVNTQGYKLGLWFYVFNSKLKTTLVKFKYTTVSETTRYIEFTIENGKLCVETFSSKSSTPKSDCIANLQEDSWYFLNITHGSFFSSASGSLLISLYEYTSGSIKPIKSTSISFDHGTSQGDCMIVSFGNTRSSSSSTTKSPKFVQPSIGFSQAYYLTVHSNNPSSITQIDKFANQVLCNGPLYNNTINAKNAIYQDPKSIRFLVYWFFVYPYINNAPSEIPGYYWYTSEGGTSVCPQPGPGLLTPTGPETYTLL